MAGTYTAPEWLSAPMKDLLARMLTVDPDKRISFQQVRRRPGGRARARAVGRARACVSLG